EFYQGVMGSIASSTIKNNINYGIYSQTDTSFHAESNWWATSTGPYQEISNPQGGGDKIAGSVNFYPWLTEDPTALPHCCSNILFIPGIEASRLYINDNKIWEPGLTTGVKKLYLDASGNSINQVYTKDIVGAGLGYDVYGDF